MGSTLGLVRVACGEPASGLALIPATRLVQHAVPADQDVLAIAPGVKMARLDFAADRVGCDAQIFCRLFYGQPFGHFLLALRLNDLCQRLNLTREIEHDFF